MKKRQTVRILTALLALLLCLNMIAFADGEKVTFTDVKESDYFYPAVQWGAEAGITNGTSANRFSPQGKVTRAQVVTFLWRMAGTPEPTNKETFTDVVKDSWYEKAVQWAVENKITNGTGRGKFSPEVTCDRAMCLTLLYRMKGSPLDEYAAADPVEFTEDSSLEEFAAYIVQQLIELYRGPEIFPDVQEGMYYELAVIWGSMNKILTDDNTGVMEQGVKFRPADPCIRSEMISFLYQTKLMEDAENAPEKDEFGPITLLIPKEYSGLVYRTVNAIGDDEDGTIVTISEIASREAAEAMGEEPDDGAGELFAIGRVSADDLHEMLCNDMSGAEIFAKDENGKYYVFYHPTDVRYIRKTNEQMVADQEQWTALNEWARKDVRRDIVENSEGLTAITFTNTSLDMMLARIAYQEGTKYTVSTTQFGPLEPGSVDPKPYVEKLLAGNFAPDEDAEAPDGEYVVLKSEDDGTRFDFFTGDKDLVREVRGETETFYRRVNTTAGETSMDIMQSWYDALAKAAGKS